MAAGGTFDGWARRALRALTAFAFLAGAAAPAPAAEGGAAASRVPQPTVAISAPGKCVEDTPFMLRNHMEVLKHHRDRTVHEGVRTTQHSLANCVNCHASPKSGRAAGGKDAFCESCHRFAAVKLDCFECHADRSQPGLAANAAPPAGVPR
jgi:hypothetical protein